jgi:hypothetical protein
MNVLVVFTDAVRANRAGQCGGILEVPRDNLLRDTDRKVFLSPSREIPISYIEYDTDSFQILCNSVIILPFDSVALLGDKR